MAPSSFHIEPAEVPLWSTFEVDRVNDYAASLTVLFALSDPALAFLDRLVRGLYTSVGASAENAMDAMAGACIAMRREP